jgi:glucosamine--fructose-6-phosphate aminotransferase (isomerizing)
MATERVILPVKLPFDFKDIQRISISACGTANYAGYVAKYWLERFSRLPGVIDIASTTTTAGAGFDAARRPSFFIC